jgi:glucose/mannose-6-phosphate isomerase
MMILDDHRSFSDLDRQNMLAHIDGLPDQLKTAWESGSKLPLPGVQTIERVVIAGLGGSAIGADLLAAYVLDRCRVPVFVHRDYGLPAWARGPETLVAASSHSGNTEETLDSFEQALHRSCTCLAITTGGKVADAAEKAGAAAWVFKHHGQPRSAVGFSFGLLLALFSRLDLIPDQAHEVENAVKAMHAQQGTIGAESPLRHNPAKRLAGQMIGRYVAFFGSGILAPVARRWKSQVNELAKAWAQFEFLPEADHNTLASALNPEELLGRTTTIFLQSSSDHPRNQLRSQLTRKVFMLDGLSTDFVEAAGDTPLAHQWTTLHYGDYASYYLAMLYGVDPTPVEALQSLKKEMEKSQIT